MSFITQEPFLIYLLCIWYYKERLAFSTHSSMITLLLRLRFTISAEANTSCFPKPRPHNLLPFQCKHLLRCGWNCHLSIFATYLGCKKLLANSYLATILTIQLNMA